MIDHIKLVLGWRVTCKWLRRAEATIRQECDETRIAHWLGDFEGFLRESELECALNALEEACEAFMPSANVWNLMADAAESMKLEGQAAFFRQSALMAERGLVTA